MLLGKTSVEKYEKGHSNLAHFQGNNNLERKNLSIWYLLGRKKEKLEAGSFLGNTNNSEYVTLRLSKRYC